MKRENLVLSNIISYLRNLSKTEPLFYQRRQAGGFSYKKGLPDLYILYKGHHIEVEVKDENGTLSIMQQKYKSLFESINITYIVAKSVNDVKSVISRINEK